MHVVHSAGDSRARGVAMRARRPPRLAEFMSRIGIRVCGAAAYERLLHEADAKPETFWREVFDYFGIRFAAPCTRILDTSFGMPWTVWCVGGETNLVHHCLDRHRDTPVWTKPALVWRSEDGRSETLSYREIDAAVCRLAIALCALGVRPGDVVGLRLPGISEAVIATLAVLKIGAVLLPLERTLGDGELARRLGDAQAVVLVTADRDERGTATEALRTAIAELPDLQHHIIVCERGMPIVRRRPRIQRWHRLVRRGAAALPTLTRPADAPALIVYTEEGSGPAVATVQTHGGFLAKLLVDFGLCLDWRQEDRVAWIADPGTLAGPLQIVATTLLGATLILAGDDESAAWRFAGACEASVLALDCDRIDPRVAADAAAVAAAVSPALREVVAVGTGSHADAHPWITARLCRDSVPLLRYETCIALGGGVLTGTLLHGAGCVPVPGCRLDLVAARGDAHADAASGALVLRRPYIALTRGLWNDPARYLERYWSRGPEICDLGLAARRRVDGSWSLIERIPPHPGRAPGAGAANPVALHSPAVTPSALDIGRPARHPEQAS